jgi:hypothetical protein
MVLNKSRLFLAKISEIGCYDLMSKSKMAKRQTGKNIAENANFI